MMLILALTLLSARKRGIEARGGRSKEGRTGRNSDARRGCSHRFNSVRGVGCEEQEKTWTVSLGSTP